MGVTVRAHRGGRWMVDIRGSTPDGRRYRDRRVSPVTSKTGSKAWGLERERLLALGQVERGEAPTLAEFEDDFIKAYAKANQQKHATIVGKLSIFKHHLVPALGGKRLDEITTADVDALKGKLTEAGRSAKGINDVLSALRTVLTVAADWDVIPKTKAKIRGLKVVESELEFYDEEEFDRLVDGARRVGPQALAMVLLGGEAGMRQGEIVAVEWKDCDLRRGIVTVRRNEWRHVVGSPKGNKGRVVPMTDRLQSALDSARHLRGDRVLYRDNGKTASPKALCLWMLAAQKLAGLTQRSGGVHILRHTFGARLAMRGAAPKAIQELMGHRHLTTTMRYLHLSPAAREGAMRLLEKGNTLGNVSAAKVKEQ